MKRLLLCRHAKSSWKYDTPDLYRPLNGRGIKQAPLMAQHCHFKPDMVVCSPAVRAWSTAVCYFESCNWDYDRLHFNSHIHEASEHTLLAELQKIRDTVQHLAIFGHNPGLNGLIAFLDKSAQPHLNLVTSGTVELELDVQSWSDLNPGCARIIHWLTPSKL